jgi:hypothetical protein
MKLESQEQQLKERVSKGYQRAAVCFAYWGCVLGSWG